VELSTRYTTEDSARDGQYDCGSKISKEKKRGENELGCSCH